LQRGRQLLKPPNVEGAGVVDLVAADDGDGDGHVLRGFAAAARGDDDVVAIGGLHAFPGPGTCGGGGLFRKGRFGGKQQKKRKRDRCGRKGPLDGLIYGHDNFLLREIATSGGPVCGMMMGIDYPRSKEISWGSGGVP